MYGVVQHVCVLVCGGGGVAGWGWVGVGGCVGVCVSVCEYVCESALMRE